MMRWRERGEKWSHQKTPFLNAFINGIVGTIAGMLSGHFWLDKQACKHCPLPWSSLDTLAQEKVFQHWSHFNLSPVLKLPNCGLRPQSALNFNSQHNLLSLHLILLDEDKCNLYRRETLSCRATTERSRNTGHWSFSHPEAHVFILLFCSTAINQTALTTFKDYVRCEPFLMGQFRCRTCSCGGERNSFVFLAVTAADMLSATISSL